ncbi:MAG: MBL fold metallo-hydrolase, partial [Deltaproteobacteria bacterium]|nr:MBL fold metallo-hydrolase [Deltaproteobacteria bacterium]
TPSPPAALPEAEAEANAGTSTADVPDAAVRAERTVALDRTPASTADESAGAPWSVHAVEYARSRAIPRGRLVRGARRGRVDMSWYFFVARRADRVVLIDCGTNVLSRPGSDLRSRWSIADAVSVTEALGRLDLAPEHVTDVVLTHHHWDHVGALGLFETARVHVHPAEWRSVSRALRAPVEDSGRLYTVGVGAQSELHEGLVLPGLGVYEAGHHTAHQLMVTVACEGGAIIIAGDAAYLYENIEGALPVTVTRDATANVADVGAAVRGVGAGRVIPGHDPEVFLRYASAHPRVAAICP